MKFVRFNFLTKICLIWGIFWGALSFTVYFLGLLGLWYRPVLWGVFALAIFMLIWYLRQNKIIQEGKKFFQKLPPIFKKEKFLFISLAIILIFIILNFIGAIAPEKEFDALWYHLTIPKIYLFDHRVHFIPGGLFYYSAMPRLAEMLYGLTLSFASSGLGAKILHFAFGVMWALFSFQILRLFFSRTLSALLTLVLYSLLIVAQLSGTAYIDLIVSFYVAGAIWGFLEYLKTKKKPYLYLMALFLGFNLASKIYGVMIAAVLGLVLLWRARGKEWLIAGLIVIAVPFVYYLNAFLATGNPIYPVFSIKDSAFDLWIRGAATYHEWLWRVWLWKLPALFWAMIVYKFAPVFGLIFLLPFTNLKKNPLILPVLVSFLLFFIFWSLLPVWEPRYLMVVLPLLAILTGWIIMEIKSIWFKIGVAVLMSWGLIYNFNLSYKNFQHPLELAQGQITRRVYLEKYIGNVWYNFYDPDGFWAKNLKPGERLLTVNFHNLFYAPDGFIDWSVIEKETSFASVQEFREKLRAQGITYLAITDKDLNEFFGFSRPEIAANFELVWQKDKKWYYKLK